MAALALRLGRKILQLEAPSLRAVQPSVALCTKSGRPKEEPTKNVVTPEKKSKVQAAKSTVELPKVSSHSSHPTAAGETVTSGNPDGPPRVTDKEIAQFSAKKTLVGFPLRDPFPVAEDTVSAVGAAVDGPTEKEIGKEETPSSSSSSSESDSDSSSGSDSDGEDDAVEGPVKTKVEFPVRGPSLIEMRDVNKEANNVDKGPAVPKKHTRYGKMDTELPTAVQPKDSRKITKADGGTAEKTSVSRITRPTEEKTQNMISKPRTVGKPAKPGVKVDTSAGALPVTPPTLGPTQIKLFKKTKAGDSKESRGTKGAPLENPEQFLKGLAPVMSPETVDGQSILGKATQDCSTQGASSQTKEPRTTLDRAIQSEETVTPPDAAAETGKPSSPPGVPLEILEPSATPNIAAEIVEPSTTPDKATEILEPSSTPDKAPEVLELSATPDNAAEILEPSTTPDKAAEILEPSAAPDNAAEILKESTTPDEATKTEEPGTTLGTDAETGEPSTILEAEAATATHEQEFDNSTYRNLQHHSFTPYTFVDIDLELSKFRLPQPSSGRPSPQH